MLTNMNNADDDHDETKIIKTESNKKCVSTIETDDDDTNKHATATTTTTVCKNEINEDLHELNEFSPDEQSHLHRNQCPICLAQFDLEKSYVEHMWQVHNNKRPFRCEDCGLYLSYRSSLYNHRKIHSDKRPFLCTECTATFRWNNSLKYHMKRAHDKDPPWIVAKRPKTMRKPSLSTTMTPSPPAPPSASGIVGIESPASAIVCIHCEQSFAFDTHAEHERSCVKKSIMEVIESISSIKEENAATPSSLLLPERKSRKCRLPTKLSVVSTSTSSPPTTITTSSSNCSLPSTTNAKRIRIDDSSSSQRLSLKLDIDNYRISSLQVSGEDEPPMLNETLSQLHARQDAIVRRLETFEQWMHERVGKMELILASLVTKKVD